MPFALSCTICAQPFSLVENITNRLLQRCNVCERRLRAFQEDTLEWLEQAFQESAGVTEEIERVIYESLEILKVPSDLEQPITSRLGYLRNLSKIRHGDFPHVRTDIHIDTDEYAHFEIPTTFLRKHGGGVRHVPGRLIGTNRKGYFVADAGSGSATFSWGNVIQTKEETLTVPSLPDTFLDDA